MAEGHIRRASTAEQCRNATSSLVKWTVYSLDTTHIDEVIEESHRIYVVARFFGRFSPPFAP